MRQNNVKRVDDFLEPLPHELKYNIKFHIGSHVDGTVQAATQSVEDTKEEHAVGDVVVTAIDTTTFLACVRITQILKNLKAELEFLNSLFLGTNKPKIVVLYFICDIEAEHPLFFPLDF
ncbi:hypothetical protein GOBAR_AA19612 [Gossypium barbadense]|uniref:Uncharacterized protein n=1 Tax=Gossypium barbadense TaxID=3634 RepID=A0A2P5XCK5_GOSBA|nr:hypothetical protein GOBAR_AA19612 [Gossypium barbadense]